MKQLLRGLCLMMCLNAYAFSQTESVTSVVSEAAISTSERAGSWYLFGVEVDVSEQQTAYRIVDGVLEPYLLDDELPIQESIVAFVTGSGLYSGFGTAWHRNYPARYDKGMKFSNRIERKTITTTQINLGSLFKTSLSYKDELNAPSFHSSSLIFSQPLIQVSLGYRNSF